MNAATYHVTTPAQLQRVREEQRRAEEKIARSVERIAQLTRSLRVTPPVAASSRSRGMNRALSIFALASLAACGGGGGGSGGGFAPIAASPAPAAEVPVQTAPAVKPTVPPSNLVNPNCVTGADGLLVTCELAPSPWPIGVTVPASGFVTFTNRTGSYLQVNSIEAFTGETTHWGEFCAALNFGSNRQDVAGIGEVACTTKAENQNYLPLTFGQGTGLLVEPGGVVILGSKPATVSHTYALNVAPNATGVQVWRAPAVDEVIPCNGLPQYTAWNPWKNDSGYTKHISGALIYNESGSANRAELNGHACLYVLNPDGTPRVSQCDDSLRTRGSATFSGIEVFPGESVAAQAVNTCSAPKEWDWAAYLQVW
ncbi:hypothetical protein J7E70_02005 [Variovorax paradoxus]|nr:hypothetical protein [Variovorax paradoxus]MBT2299228.1 hypothetical protein [Variovorax paradoxus]